jgi:two-component system CheB/CheR fusion protein
VKRQEAVQRPPVVGLGGSAGALAAFKAFLKNLPPEARGLAYVVVQHLAPDHPSSLPELLGPEVPFPVVQVTERLEVQPDHLYVIAPGTLLEYRRGFLEPRPATREEIGTQAIDIFFSRLAEEFLERAIGVLFSGAGSDGVQGLARIKAAEGFVAIQDPETAETPEMPAAARDALEIDVCAVADEIPLFIWNYVQNLELLDRERLFDPLEAEAFDLFQETVDTIKKHTGHDFSQYKTNTLLRRLARRMSILRIPRFQDYLALLRQSREEVEAIFEEFLIGVTRFFRDSPLFRQIEDQILPEMMRARAREAKKLRIWVAACSTGEEAYSYAICCLEAARKHQISIPIQVFATDLDPVAIEKARKGRYPDAVAREVPAEQLEKYFQPDGHGYRVKKEVRGLVVFSTHNVITDPPYSQLDLISCRNLLIYFKAELQNRVIGTFIYSLNPDGYLLLGSSESPAAMTNYFVPVDKRWKVFRKIGGIVPREIPWRFPDMTPKTGTESGSPQTPSTPGTSFPEITRAIILERFAPLGVLIDPAGNIVFIQGNAHDFLVRRSGKPSNRLADNVAEELRIQLANALRRVNKKHREERIQTLFPDAGNPQRMVRITIAPLTHPASVQNHLLVVFQECPNSKVSNLPDEVPSEEREIDKRIRELEHELHETRQFLQTTIDDLERANEVLVSTNEEAQSVNEELQSANEELESSKEELQSTNEELINLNAEYQKRIDELTRANNDIHNFVRSTQIAMVFLDRNLRIVRFTPAIQTLFDLVESDVGRPLESFITRICQSSLAELALQVMSDLQPVEHRVSTVDGKIFWQRVHPYRTLEDRIEGVVITFTELTELERTREALRSSEARYLELFGNIRTAIATYEAVDDGNDFVFRDFNPWAERLEKVKKADILGRRVTDVFPGVREFGLLEVLKKVWKTGTPEWHDAKLYKDNRIAGWRENQVYRLPSGEVLAVYQDVTEQKQVRDSLLESETRFRAIIEVSPIGIGIVRKGLHFLVNRAYLSMLGYADEKELLSQPISLCLAPEVHEKIVARNRAREKGTAVPVNYETIGRRANGEVFPMEVAEIRTQIGSDTVMVAFFQDISERRRVENALRASEERYRTLVESLPNGVYECDLDGIVTQSNSGLAKITGFPLEETVGKMFIWDFMAPGPEKDRFPEYFRDLVKNQPVPQPYQGRNQTSDGRLVDIQCDWSYKRNDKSELLGFACIISDVTELRRAEEESRRLEVQMLQSQKLESLGVLTGGIAHDFNNILMAILGNVDLALSDIPAHSPTRKYLQSAEKASRRAADLCQQMLAYSGKGRTLISTIDLNTLICDVFPMVEMGVSKKVSLAQHLNENLPGLEGDATQIRQVIMNLLINAAESIGDAVGIVTVATRVAEFSEEDIAKGWLNHHATPGLYLVLEVKDTGCGMDAETLARIFDPFFTTKFMGRGLGLAAVLGIVRSHRGNLYVETAPNKGAMFRVLFPALGGAAVLPLKSNHHLTTGIHAGHGLVLLVDDEEAVREVSRKMLESLGYQVVLATNGREAIEIARMNALQNGPDRFKAIVLDLTMPEMDGIETLNELSQILVGVPVILSSGYNEQEVADLTRGKSFAGFIQKPYRLSSLGGTLEKILTIKASETVIA